MELYSLRVDAHSRVQACFDSSSLAGTLMAARSWLQGRGLLHAPCARASRRSLLDHFRHSPFSCGTACATEASTEGTCLKSCSLEAASFRAPKWLRPTSAVRLFQRSLRLSCSGRYHAGAARVKAATGAMAYALVTCQVHASHLRARHRQGPAIGIPESEPWQLHRHAGAGRSEPV